jgi:hypothetical protein
MNQERLIELFIQHGMEWVFVGAATGLAWLLSKFIGLKIGSAKTDAIVDRVAGFARLIVLDLEATLRPTLRAVTADGKLSPQEKVQLRGEALARLRGLLGEHGMTELAGVLGVAAPKLADVLLGHIETAVLEMKAAKATASP